MRTCKSFILYLYVSLILFHTYSAPQTFSVLERLFLYKELSRVDLINAVDPVTKDGRIRAVIEIPAGSNEKWKVSKDGMSMVREFKEGKPTTIDYLGYPTNYGFIPKSLMPIDKGGDGDPLDALVLGNSLPRGKIVIVKPIGILKMTLTNTKDIKLITLHSSSPLYSKVNNINELNEKYPGITHILQSWFGKYQMVEKMNFNGFGNLQEAKKTIEVATKSYAKQMKKK